MSHHEKTRPVIPDTYDHVTCYKKLFERASENGFEIHKVDGDGNCYFRSFSHQFCNTEDFHPFFRAVTVAWMRANYIAYASAFQQQFPFQSYEKYCDHVSKLKTPVGEIPILASCEAFGVRIVRLYGYGHRVLDYLTPRNRDPKKVLCISFLYNHADSMFRTGTKPLPLLEPLSKQRLEELRLGGFYTVDDHGRNQRLLK